MDLVSISVIVLALLIPLGFMFMMLLKNQKQASQEISEAMTTKLGDLDKSQQNIVSKQEALEKNQERLERSIRDEINKVREDTQSSSKQSREELSSSVKNFSDSLFTHMRDISGLQKDQLGTFSKQLEGFRENFVQQFGTVSKTNNESLTRMRDTIEERLNSVSKGSTENLSLVRETLEKKLQQLQEDNSKRLEQMRATVDEKLQSTLERRLGESFKLVSDRLEQVHKGLGEMQNLATGVGDLKKVLTNVKTRGTWGEVQLGNLLEQLLTKEQYEQNVATKKGSNDRVEFAIKLPGSDEDKGELWLPLDAKFPQEDYQRLLDAHDSGQHEIEAQLEKQIELRIKASAKDIATKYVDPPNTTDFAIMFLPVEGLYAEVVRKPGLTEALQRDFRVVVAGPTTLAALLNSLQMGFKTLAIQKRSSEVWTLLAAVKTEFTKFGDILDKTQKKLQEASNTIETAARKSRTIERKLRNVEELPQSSAPEPLSITQAS